MYQNRFKFILIHIFYLILKKLLKNNINCALIKIHPQGGGWVSKVNLFKYKILKINIVFIKYKD